MLNLHTLPPRPATKGVDPLAKPSPEVMKDIQEAAERQNAIDAEDDAAFISLYEKHPDWPIKSVV